MTFVHVYRLYSLTCACVQSVLCDLYMCTVCTLWPVQAYILYSLTCTSVQSVLSDPYCVSSLYSLTCTACPICTLWPVYMCTVCTLWPVLRVQSHDSGPVRHRRLQHTVQLTEQTVAITKDLQIPETENEPTRNKYPPPAFGKYFAPLIKSYF